LVPWYPFPASGQLMGTAEIGTAVPVSSARQARGRGLEEVTDYQGQARRSPLEVQRGLRVEEIWPSSPGIR
jgi:hypothetical protein